MSNTLSATFGYGIVIPNGEDDDHEFDTSPGSFLADYYQNDAYWDVGITWDDALDALGRKLNLVYDMAYVHDYNAGSVLFAGPVIEGFGVISTFPKVPEISEIQVRALEVAAETLGIPFEPTWVLAASYG